jgi:hypothetical protein
MEELTMELTKKAMELTKKIRQLPVRLACVKHAASVHPKPGSNSP